MFSCYIIAETVLGEECAATLRTQGWQVLGIVTAAQDFPDGQPFDYLFSIVNHRFLPAAVLAAPRLGAINYHDGPLPRYAGLNATAWAILNGESTHGITWHYMTDEVDAGDILAQVAVPVAPDETAHSLSIKCASAALQAFAELLPTLPRPGTPQDLRQRTYYPLTQKPPRQGFLSWQEPATASERLFRALSFGPAPNRLATAKVWMGGAAFVPTDLTVLPTPSTQPPGTVVDRTASTLTVATTTQDVQLAGLRDLDGQPATLPPVAKLEEPPAELLHALQDLAPHEAFWVKQLTTAAAPVAFPNLEKNPDPTFLAAVFIYLHRLGYPSRLTLGIAPAAPPLSLLPRQVPLILDLPPQGTLGAIQTLVEAALKQLRQHKAYLRDVGLRYPPLREVLPAASLDLPVDWFAHIKAICEGITNSPDSAYERFSFLTAQEQRQLINWNSTDNPYPQRCVHKLFVAQATKTPAAIAMVGAAKQWTYAELNTQANQLAHYLRRWGVGPDIRVALLAVRSPQAVIGLLAVLKAGGAYVPLDPKHPPARLQRILDDVQAPVLLMSAALQERLPAYTGKVVILEDAAITQEPTTDPDTDILPYHLAYVLYTSGSTGIPKGIAMAHGGLVNLLVVNRQILQHSQRLLQFASLGFDMSFLEIFGAFHLGATLYIPSDDERLDPQYVQQHNIDTVMLPVTVLNQWADADLSCVKNIVTAGEQLLLTPALRALLQTCRLHNYYGPTETHVVTAYTCGPETPLHVPIGKPIANNQIHIVDAYDNPVPIGAVGEIVVSGAGLARGYLHQPPFGDRYRTGDLGRYLPDGNIAFLGRRDQQVKVRGYRIELGEIVAALKSHPHIADAFVNEQLAAYVVLKDTQSVDLKAYLAGLLPDYMIPTHIQILDSLPLNANGKVDRHALPKLMLHTYVPPRTPLQQRLCAIWAAVLKVDRVGCADNFFHLGGHSLTAVRVIARLRETDSRDIPLRLLFDHPTIAALSQALENVGYSTLPPIMPIGRDGPLPLSFAQQRLWFLEQLIPARALYHIPMAFKLSGQLDKTAMEKAFQALIQRHEALRTVFPAHDGEPTQGILPQVTPAATAVFDLATGPLIHVQLQEHTLTVTLHHIIADGWSLAIFCQELAAFYNHYAVGAALDLPALPVQYTDFAVWQRQWLQGEVLEEQLTYWQQQLAGIEDLALSTDHPRPDVLTYQGASHEVHLSSALKEPLVALAHAHQASLFMVLLAAFQVLLYRCSGQRDIVTGTPVANRHYPGIEGLIGFFANTLALRTQFTDNETFATVLAKVKEATLQAYQHQDLPFERLVEALTVPRALNRNPVFQVLFTLQNTPESYTFENLVVEPLKTTQSLAKFDLSLNVCEEHDGLTLQFDYMTDLFEAATIGRFAETFKTLLQDVVAHPHQPIGASVQQHAVIRPQQVSTPIADTFPNATQAALMAIWAEVLKVRPDVHANFFESGGNSLLAIRLITLMCKHFAKDIPVAVLFQYPTIAALAQMLDTAEVSPLLTIKEGVGTPLCLIHPGGGLAFCYQALAPYIEQPLIAINNPHFTNPHQGFSSLAEMAQAYLAMIEVRPCYLAGWSFGGLVALEMAQQLGGVACLVLMDTINPQAFLQQPTWRLEEDAHYLAENETVRANIKASMALATSYQPPFYAQRTVLLRAKSSHFQDYGWDDRFRDLTTHEIPGSHFKLFDADHIATTAAALRQALALPQDALNERAAAYPGISRV